MIVEYETNGRVATITLNRPEARNAVSAELAQGLEAAVDRLENDDEVWVGVLAGNGPVFSAGADLKAVASGNARLATSRGGFAGFVTLDRSKPIIAAVEGVAVAGGCEIVLACDLVVASREAAFGLPEVKRSLVASAGGTARLPKKIPPNIAMEVALTGDNISAERAHQFGLVNILCESGEALDRAHELADRINANAPLAVRATRTAVNAGSQVDDEEGINVARNVARPVLESEDHKEGPLAFVEKRDPVWQAR
ncbi:MAG: crotonase/enoyl-CoA hydratase family protein [Acidimicrobiales bacterium]